MSALIYQVQLLSYSGPKTETTNQSYTNLLSSPQFFMVRRISSRSLRFLLWNWVKPWHSCFCCRI